MIFSVDEDKVNLEELENQNFSDFGISERDDIEKWVVKKPRLLGEELLIITTEYDNYEELRDRLDVLALDKDGKLVVIELKRDKADKTTDLQAIKYASFVATHTAKDVQKEYRKFWSGEDGKLPPETVGERFGEFLSASDLEVNISESGWAEFELDNKPRIVLAAGSFGKEVTAPVLWLRDEYGIDVTCVEFNPLKHEDKILINSRIIIPVPETEDYMAKRREKQEKQESSEISETRKMQGDFWQGFREFMEAEGTDLRLRTPRARHNYDFAIGLGSQAYIRLIVDTRNKEARCDLNLEKKGTETFDALKPQKEEIEDELEGDLKWERKGDQQRSIITQSKDFDIRNNDWEEIYPWLKERVEKFHEVFSPRIKEL